MSIKVKIIGGFLLVLVVTASLNLLAYTQIMSISKLLSSDIPLHIEAVNQTTKINELDQLLRFYGDARIQSARNYVFTQNILWKQKFHAFAAELESLGKQASEVDKIGHEQYFRTFNIVNASITTIELQAFKHVDAGDKELAISLLDSSEYWRLKQDYGGLLQISIPEHRSQFLQALEQSIVTVKMSALAMQDTFTTSIKIASILLISGLFFTLILGFLITRSIAIPLATLTKATRNIKQKSLTSSLDKGLLNVNNELGDLARAFDHMTKDLQQTTVSRDHLTVEVQQREQAEQSYKQLCIDLEQRVDERTTELQGIRDELEQRVEERTQTLLETQHELVQKERLATLGQLTATVSHELRNPLATMRNSLYSIQKKSDAKDMRLQNSLGRLQRGISRCDHIIDELLDFTRNQVLERQNIAVDLWLAEVLDEQTVPEGIHFNCEFNLSGFNKALDPNRLRRAIINVFENACQSMLSEDGLVLGDGRLTVQTQQTNQRVEIIFADSGTGIPPDVLPRIFEPLYSTKSFGVGLGLPTVKHIMEQHGGGIDVDTEEGRGTHMTLWLPLSSAQ